MRMLLTADWQADTHNLAKCVIVRDELIAHIKEYKPDAVVHAGDLKHAYNPIDGHVINFWTKTTKLLVELCPFFINLGNHDNFSQSLKSENWFDVLRSNGARTASRGPAVYQVGDGHIAMLPFTKDKKLEQEWADNLVEDQRIKEGPCILIFHTEQTGASLGGKRTWKNTDTNLHAEKYLGAFGGHFHEHQRLEGTNIWYVGSPFCQDWGEANQTKGHFLVDTANLNRQWSKQLSTQGIPGWYDSWYLKKNNVTPEPGAYIRRKVSVNSRHITRQIHVAEEKLRKLYGDDKQYFVIPKMVDQKVDGLRLNAASDSEQLTDYLIATLPEAFKTPVKRVHAYMLEKLQHTRQVLPGSELRFLGISARNVLVFPEIKINFEKQGLVLVTGVNKDWQDGNSNGAGKTSLLSLLPVALCGTTTKKQKNNAWAHERNKKPAVIMHRLRDSAGNLIKITRQARPHALTLTVDKKDKTSGMRGTTKAGTQGDIERLIGMDYRMLMNSVYFDQTIANSFVSGTQTTKMELISKLQNLERFDVALASVKVDLKKCIERYDELVSEQHTKTVQMLSYEEQLTLLEAQTVNDYTDKVAKLQKELNVARHEAQKLADVKSTYEAMQIDADALTAELQKTKASHTEATIKFRQLQDNRYRTEQLRRKGRCGTCGQDTKSLGMTDENLSVQAWSDADKFMNHLARACSTLERKLKGVNDELDSYDAQCVIAKRNLATIQHDIDSYSGMAADEKKRNFDIGIKRISISSKSNTLRMLITDIESKLKHESRLLELYEYAKKAFSRYGMPMYLSAALCPVLNNAADEYSEIFTDGKIKLTFDIVDEEFVVTVINVSGSVKTRGQSMGEFALAGIIAAFASRSVAPKTNLLIMDEPGHGLDQVSARRFAEGLLRLKDRFETILVTSHSPAIVSALAGEQIWTVTKRKGISTLEVV